MCQLKLNDLIKFNYESTSNIIKNTFPSEIGKDYMENIKIQEDFHLLKTQYLFNQATQIEAKQNDKKFVITICQKGNTSYINNDNQRINFKEGFTSISLFNQTEGFREFEDKEVKQVRLILSESFIERNLKESLSVKYFHENKNLNLISFSPTSLASQFLLDDILNCSLKGELGTLYIQAKALELLTLELSKLEENSMEIVLDSYDKDAIYKAKEILIDNLKNPPSIVELAKKVHLNEFKLKKGFKQVFNTSPYKLLNEYKMNYAKNLLESSEYNISEVADIIGYKFSNNFTNAFYKQFKINPKELIKNRKYYY
ncbi:helix-turn-helix domain-containing protein [Poseidonibacter lekithochrous]|uniref:helix-turn-helix domain-containing protein n=1 Tax=Poseidonibacter lekithochrous TaxID=1904463 RepID=UPI000D3778C0|nr:AraC family transcriptional regulator [Poseidonibacter lekithochrous]